MRLEEAKQNLDLVISEVRKVVVGQTEMVKDVLVAVLTDSHALLEGYPGLAKTLTVKTIGSLMDLKFSRIQNTPDLMPSDITGTYIVNEKREFKFQPGPVFANIVLADEINRAAPKTQSALLEAMQERQVTVGNATYKLERPFFVLATMNPIEQEGTFALPEAQADRFLLKIKAPYPSMEEELEIVERYAESNNQVRLKPVMKKETIEYLQELTRQVPIARDIKRYAVDLIRLTRTKKDLIEYGASPRASIGLILASKARALMEGRNYVSKEDIKNMAFPILRHRIILTFEAERNNLSEDDVIRELIK
ncbi:MoxR family ATPase [Candidatus Woesearchaeota archaeon]|nr:MoxR family ATPase [Candidatus Woesearchaeota archaeon]